MTAFAGRAGPAGPIFKSMLRRAFLFLAAAVPCFGTSPAAAADLQRWRRKLASGASKFSDVASGDEMIPPMFCWIVSGAGENLAEGFKRAADIYHSRAIYRTEVALFSVLPIASLFLGAVVISQAFLVICMFLPFIAMLNNF